MLHRVFEIDLDHCPNCGDELKIIAAILEQPVTEKVSCTWVCRPVRLRARQRVGRSFKRPERSQRQSTTVDRAA